MNCEPKGQGGVPYIDEAVGKSWCRQVCDAITEARNKLKGRIKLPTLEVALGTEAARVIRWEWSLMASNSHIQPYLQDNGLPEISGCRAYVDNTITPNWYEIRMKVKKGVLV